MPQPHDDFFTGFGVHLEGHLAITEYPNQTDYEAKKNGQVRLNRRNAIHKEHAIILVANAMMNRTLSDITYMVFGNGGTTLDNTGTINFNTPNVTSDPTDLYSPVFFQLVDDRVGALSGNQMSTRHISGSQFSDIEIRCLLTQIQPFGQLSRNDIAGINLTTEQFVFDEIGLKLRDGTLVTHVIFAPILKTASSLLEVVYTIRVAVGQPAVSPPPPPPPPSNGQFVMLLPRGSFHNPQLRTSPDGVTWTTHNLPIGIIAQGNFFRMIFAGSTYVCITTADEVISSTDGINWTDATIPGGTFGWWDIAFGSGLFVTVNNFAASFSMPGIATSPDGVVWTTNAIVLPSNGYFYSVAYGNGTFVAIGATTNSVNQNTTPQMLFTSPDGLVWTQQAPGITAWLSPVRFHPTFGLFVQYLPNSGVGHNFRTSPDGITWTTVGVNTPAIDTVDQIVTSSPGRYLVVGSKFDSGLAAFVLVLLTSTDGTTWTETDIHPYHNDPNDGAFGSSTFVATIAGVGGVNDVVVSTDGATTWNLDPLDWTVSGNGGNITIGPRIAFGT